MNLAASDTLIIVVGSSIFAAAQDMNIALKYMPLCVLSYVVFYGVPALIMYSRRQSVPTAGTTKFVFLPLSQMVMLACSIVPDQMSMEQFTKADGVVMLTMVVLCVATDIGFALTVRELIKKRRLEEKQELQKLHYRALMEQQQSIRKLRHDISNHLVTIERLVKEGSDDAGKYAKELKEQFRAVTTADYCDNGIANAVLYSKASEADAPVAWRTSKSPDAWVYPKAA